MRPPSALSRDDMQISGHLNFHSEGSQDSQERKPLRATTKKSRRVAPKVIHPARNATRNLTAIRNDIESEERNWWARTGRPNGCEPRQPAPRQHRKGPGSPPKSVQKELSLLGTRHLRRLLCNLDSSDAETWQRP